MDLIFDFIENYGLIAVLVLIFLEYACFPLPSEVILPIAGAISIRYNLFFVWILSVVAGILGSIVCYIVGYLGRKVIEKNLKLRIKMKYAINIYKKYQNLSVMIGRMIPICRTYISIIAGVSRMKFINFVVYSFIGIAVWNFLLMFLGYIFYDNLEIVTKIFHEFKLFIVIIVFTFLVFYLFSKTKVSIRRKKLSFLKK